MKQIAALLLLVIVLVCNLQPGFRATAPSAYLMPTNTAQGRIYTPPSTLVWHASTVRPTIAPTSVTWSPVTPVRQPAQAAMEMETQMENMEIVYVGVLFVLLAIVVFLLRQDSEKTKRIVEMAGQLKESLPEWAAAMFVTGIEAADDTVDVLIGGSKNKIDDTLWAELEPRLRAMFNLPPDSTPQQVDARLGEYFKKAGRTDR